MPAGFAAVLKHPVSIAHAFPFGCPAIASAILIGAKRLVQVLVGSCKVFGISFDLQQQAPQLIYLIST